MKWLILASKILGTLAFVIIVIDLVVARRKVPPYIFAISFLTLLGAIIFAILNSFRPIDYLWISLFSIGAPFLLWILTGASIFAKSGKTHEKNNQTKIEDS